MVILAVAAQVGIAACEITDPGGGPDIEGAKMSLVTVNPMPSFTSGCACAALQPAKLQIQVAFPDLEDDKTWQYRYFLRYLEVQTYEFGMSKIYLFCSNVTPKGGHFKSNCFWEF